jgi:hypothetical protein
MPDRLATQLLLMARSPASGAIRNAGRVDIALRAALFTDLLLTERIVGQAGAPAIGVDLAGGDPGDRVLDAVVRTVAKRPHVAWWRWFRHVRDDRQVLVEELLSAGRWTAKPGRRARWDPTDDTEAARALEQCFELGRIARGEVGLGDVGQATLAILASMSGVLDGRPRPRALRGDLKPVMTAIGASGAPGAAYLPQMLSGAAVLSRRRLR